MYYLYGQHDVVLEWTAEVDQWTVSAFRRRCTGSLRGGALPGSEVAVATCGASSSLPISRSLCFCSESACISVVLDYLDFRSLK